MNKQELISFTDDIIKIYESGVIKAPVHFSKNNENQLIEIFEKIHTSDTYIFSTWRSHYHALLHGVPKELVKEEILKGNSITLNFPEYNFYTSAIVGGIIPIATGTAMGLKLKHQDTKVLCFIGDMAYESGIFQESYKYATNFDLPIIYIIEVNNLSVYTPIKNSWGYKHGGDLTDTKIYYNIENKLIKYNYERVLPHTGSGTWINF